MEVVDMMDGFIQISDFDHVRIADITNVQINREGVRIWCKSLGIWETIRATDLQSKALIQLGIFDERI